MKLTAISENKKETNLEVEILDYYGYEVVSKLIWK